MTETEFEAWSIGYTTLFAMTSDAELAMVGAWWQSLRDYCAADMEAAARYVAEHDPPNYRDKHLSRLMDRLRVIETERQRRAREEEAARNGEMTEWFCEICGNSGVVAVPHIRHVLDGRWVRLGRNSVTMAVSCKCQAGDRRKRGWEEFLSARKSPGLSVWSLERYEHRIPHWRQLVGERDAEAKEEAKARQKAAVIDRKLGPLGVVMVPKRLAEAFKVPRG